MKHYFFLIFLCLSGCQQVDFSKASSFARNDYKFYSSQDLCDRNPKACEEDGFLQLSSSPWETENAKYFTEYFKVPQKNDLEILIVVDVSRSMDKNLKKLGESLSSLLEHIEGKNWRIAFITADHGDHKSVRSSSDSWRNYIGSSARFGRFMQLEKSGQLLDYNILTKTRPDYKQIFEDTLTREKSSNCAMPPGCQGNTEQPLRSLKAAFQRYAEGESVFKEFFKPKADTVVLIATDEDERGGDSKNATTAEDIIQEYNRVFSGKKKRLFGFSISIQDKDCYKKENGRLLGILGGSAARYGHIIGRLAELTGGENVSLCESDYSASLKQVSAITKKLIHSFVLEKRFYIPESVEVSFFPEQDHITWTLEGQRLVFSESISSGVQVEVSYEYE